jgi:hypothetical protein
MSHLNRDQIAKLLKAELPRGEIRDIVRHLLTGCRQCARVAQELVNKTGILGEPYHSDDPP